jgi:hypothetical protein
MSNRTEDQSTFAAELKAAHLAQIEALTMPGLTKLERIERFATAARFYETQRQEAIESARATCDCCKDNSAAGICWREGAAPYSLFADLPGCRCPVMEVMGGAKLEGIPDRIPYDWSPTAEQLLPFARIQQERRLG